jgi:hypothetical protein
MDIVLRSGQNQNKQNEDFRSRSSFLATAARFLPEQFPAQADRTEELCGDGLGRFPVRRRPVARNERGRRKHFGFLQVFTDPPYNVDYEGYTEEKLKIQGDQMTPEQFQEFLTSVFSAYAWAAFWARAVCLFSSSRVDGRQTGT